MEKKSVIFVYQSRDLIIPCSDADKMGDICKKLSIKLERRLDSLVFLYGGGQINFDKTFEEQASLIDKANKQMKIIVINDENKEFICPKCGEKVEIKTEKIDEIILSNNNIKDTINGIKFQLDNIIKISTENTMTIQLKNINILLKTLKEDIQKNNEKLEKFFNEYRNYYFQNKNVIKGILDIKVNEISKEKGFNLFNTLSNMKAEVYINNKRVNLIKEKHLRKIDYNFQEDGKYKFEIKFNEKVTDLTGFFEGCRNIISLDFSNFDSSQVTSMKCMLSDCNQLKEIRGMFKLKTKNVTNMKAMFQICKELEYLDFSSFDTSNVIDMCYMFTQCNKLKEIQGLNNFNTKKVTTMEAMFQLCTELEYLNLTSFDTSNVISMKRMFNECHKLKEIKGLQNFNTSKVASMKVMFANCQELESLNLSSFDTSNITDMTLMFSQCFKLKEIIGLNKFVTNKVTNMEGMFQKILEIQTINVSNFDTSNVTSMKCMFSQCNKLTEIKGLNNFNTKNVTNMEAMFQLCTDIEYLDLTNFDTSNVTSMKSMFRKCCKLKQIKGINNFNTSKVTNMNGMFDKCNEIESLDLSNFNTNKVSDMSNMFSDCNNLKELNLLNFNLIEEAKDMLLFQQKSKCNFTTKDKSLLKLYNSTK